MTECTEYETLTEQEERAARLLWRSVVGFSAPRLIKRVLKASHNRTCQYGSDGLAHQFFLCPGLYSAVEKESHSPALLDRIAALSDSQRETWYSLAESWDNGLEELFEAVDLLA